MYCDMVQDCNLWNHMGKGKKLRKLVDILGEGLKKTIENVTFPTCKETWTTQ